MANKTQKHSILNNTKRDGTITFLRGFQPPIQPLETSTHTTPTNQALKADYTEEQAARDGFGGSCYTPLVRASQSCAIVFSVEFPAEAVKCSTILHARVICVSCVPPKCVNSGKPSAHLVVQQNLLLLVPSSGAKARITIDCDSQRRPISALRQLYRRVKSRRTRKAKNSTSKASAARVRWMKLYVITCPVGLRWVEVEQQQHVRDAAQPLSLYKPSDFDGLRRLVSGMHCRKIFRDKWYKRFNNMTFGCGYVYVFDPSHEAGSEDCGWHSSRASLFEGKKPQY